MAGISLGGGIVLSGKGIGRGGITQPGWKSSAAPSTRLANTAPFTFADNSYGAQVSSIDLSGWTWMAMGCRGLPTVGLRQCRGGDRLSHLIDRMAPATSVGLNGAAIIMNVENDLADALVTNNAAGGDVMLGRLDSIITSFRASNTKMVVVKQPNTTSALTNKPLAVAQYHSGLAARAAADLVISDDPSVFNPQDALQSSDQTHPNIGGSARTLGTYRGGFLAGLYTTTGIFDAGGQLAGNINANWNMGSAGTLTNNSGCTVTQTADVLRSLPGSVPCRRLAISGTCTADPTQTAAAAGGDIQVRFSTPHQAGTNTYDITPYCIAYIEITNAAGGDPVQFATLQIQCGLSVAFGKVQTVATGVWGGGFKYNGPIGTTQIKAVGSQSLPMNTDFIFRALNGAGVDIDVRIAYVNVCYSDLVAYGPAVNASAIFTATRPVLYALPTTAPASGPLAVGGTLGVSTGLATIVGGGLTRTYDAMRDGTTNVGAAVPPTALSAAVPYTVVAGDSTHNLAIRTNASNSYGGGTSANVQSTAIAVT